MELVVASVCLSLSLLTLSLRVWLAGTLTGRIQPALFCLLFMGVAAGGFGLFKFFLAEDMTASRHLRR